MPTGAAVRAARAYVELYANRNPLTRGLSAASGQLRSWGTSISMAGAKLMAAGTALLAPLILATKQFMSAGDELDKMSQRVGASVEFLSALSYAAQLGGTDIAALEVGILRIQRTAYDASRGLTTAQDAFRDLRVQVLNADKTLKNTEQLFMESAAALAKMENNTKKAALATIVFGRAGTALLPMLRDGAEGLHAAMEQARALGIVMSTEDAAAAAELTDAWLRVKTSLKMAMVQIGGGLAPSLTDLAERVTKLIRPVIDWVRQNGALIVTIAKLAAGAVAAGGALVGLGSVIWGLGTVLGAMATAVTLAIGGLGMLVGVIGAIVSPIGLVITSLAGLGAYLLSVTGKGTELLKWLSDAFGNLKDVALQSWQGIVDALKAGDLELAAQVVWTSLKLIWAEGMNWISKQWDALLRKLSDAWKDWKVSFLTEEFATWFARLFSAPGQEEEAVEEVRKMFKVQRRKRERERGVVKPFIDDPEIARLRAELDRLTASARAKAKAAEWVPDYARRLGGGEEFPDWESLGTKIRGTFSAAAVSGLGMGNWQGKMVAAVEKANLQQAEELREIKEIHQDLKLVLRFAP